MKFTHSAIAMMKIPGHQNSQGRVENAAWLSETILPSEVSGDYSYDITVGSGTPPTFTITFTPGGAQASDGNLTLGSDGTRTPSAKW